MASVGTVVSFPTPPYQNVAIQADFYQPSRFVISGLTRGITTTITTSVNHNYVVGQNIRLLIPAPYGSYQLNETQGFVIDIPASDQVEVLINSVFADAFIASPTGNFPSQPQIMAIGDINSGPINSHGRSQIQTFIDGSFLDISPN